MSITNAKVVKIKDGQYEKVFIINKLLSERWMGFALTIMDMLVSTKDMDSNIIRQWLNNRFMNGETIKGYDPEKVDQAVYKTATTETADFIFNLLKSLFFKMEDNKYHIMEQLFNCISYQNGNELVKLTINESSPGYTGKLVEDGFNLWKLLKTAFVHNYGEYIPGMSEENTVPKP